MRTLQTTEAYGATPTPKPNAAATPTPEPTQAIDYWSRPTAIPENPSDAAGSYRIDSLFEDSWAATE